MPPQKRTNDARSIALAMPKHTEAVAAARTAAAALLCGMQRSKWLADQRRRYHSTTESRSYSLLPHLGRKLLGILLGDDVDNRTAVQTSKQRTQLLVPALGVYRLDLRREQKQTGGGGSLLL